MKKNPRFYATRFKFHHNRGQAMLIATVFFLAVSISVMLGTATPVLRQSNIAENFINSRQSYSASESGVEDVLYRLKKGKSISPTEFLTVGSSTATTTIVDVGSNEKQISTLGDAFNRFRKSQADVAVTGGVSFNYGVQVGNGGFDIQNTASINGNIYANGPILGANSNVVRGSVVSAGANGSVSGIHATSSIYAHTISNSETDENAYYQSISNTTVRKISYPGSPDQPAQPLPISDSLITQWEIEAATGGTVECPDKKTVYEIKDTTTLGPVKINCNLEISGNDFTVTLTGMVWVSGKITIKNSPTIKVSATLGNKSVAIIADKPTDRLEGSTIDLENSAGFEGSGGAGSYVVLISQNNSAENEGDITAIKLQNGAQGDLLLYSGHGEILLLNSSSLKEVTAYKVEIRNSANVTYETGLANLLFTSGPAGSWTIKGWKEQ